MSPRAVGVMPELKTGRYSTFTADQGIAVATSVGLPRFRLGYAIEHEIDALKPFGLLKLPRDRFEVAYRKRLDLTGPERLRWQFQEIAAEHPGEPLVFLCFEDVSKQWCHRRLLADWWLERTGQLIPEIELAQLTLTDQEDR